VIGRAHWCQASPSIHEWRCDPASLFLGRRTPQPRPGEKRHDTHVTDTSICHINADEPSVSDYNTEYKSTGQVISLCAADGYRCPDHDPVIVDLELGEERIYLAVVMRGFPQP